MLCVQAALQREAGGRGADARDLAVALSRAVDALASAASPVPAMQAGPGAGASGSQQGHQHQQQPQLLPAPLLAALAASCRPELLQALAGAPREAALVLQLAVGLLQLGLTPGSLPEGAWAALEGALERTAGAVPAAAWDRLEGAVRARGVGLGAGVRAAMLAHS